MNKFCNIKSALIGILALSVSSCSNNVAKSDEQGKGHIDSVTVYCDDAFSYLIDQEVRIYESQMPDQHLHMVYAPEAEVMKRLTGDSSCYAILGRRLTQQERDDLFQKSHLQVDEHTFATDAVALLAGPAFAGDTVAYSTILSLLGNTTHDYDLVFEGNGSGVINYMFAQIAHTTVHPSAYAAKNIGELVGYLQKDKKAIGFIPFARISDVYKDDTTATELLKKVKVLYVSKTDSTGKNIYAMASQSEIADGSYPLDRPVNFISHSMDEKVGTGFVNFLYREPSGRIILKAGLIPAIMPQRTINVNTDGIK